MATAGDGRGPGPERAYARPLPEAGPVRLDADESSHLVRVRRAREGDPVVLFDGEGATRLARLVRASARDAEVVVLGPYPDREPPRRVEVACALPAAGRADGLVADLAELGVHRLVPLRCERSSPAAGEAADRRKERFDRLCREAAKVNGRSRLLRVEAARSLAEAIAEARARGAGTVVILDTEPGLPGLASLLGGAPGPCLLLVGPEGGFTAPEVEEALRQGAVRASLGACALRTETAAVVAAGVALAP